MFQLHLSDQQLYCPLICILYWKFDGIYLCCSAAAHILTLIAWLCKIRSLLIHRYGIGRFLRPRALVDWSRFLRREFPIIHDAVFKWKHFPRYWHFMCKIHRSPVIYPHEKQGTRSFDVLIDLRLNKRLSKQSRHWLFEMPSRSWWRHCNVFFAAHWKWT